ncbi:MAG: ABC transporter ATP-binding protein [Candidatus Bathyarchaeia archaeon]
MDYAVETYDLGKTYRTHEGAVVALDRENLRVRRGAVFGLLGPNGAGKTTLIMMLMGLTLPTNGTAKVLGYDIIKESLKIRRKVGFAPDGMGFYDHLTAWQNLDYIAALNDIPRDERRRLIDEALATTGLSEFKDRKAGGFSKGMRQRLAIAQALLKDGDLLIFDEPTAGVDPEGTREFKALVTRLNREKGKTILIATHMLPEIGPVCSHIAIIRRGKIIVQSAISEMVEEMMREEGYLIEVELGDGNAASSLAPILGEIRDVKGVDVNGRIIHLRAGSDIRPLIAREVAERGVDLLSLRRLEPSLEDLFMKFYNRGEEEHG